MIFSYKECLKNHAASIGGHALDGCGEFMPSSSINPSDPRSLKCAACGCHRNFHRHDTQQVLPSNNNTKNPNFINCFHSPAVTAPPPPPQLSQRAMSKSTSPSLSSSPSHSPSPMSSPSPPPLSHLPPSSFHAPPPHMLFTLGTACSAHPSDQKHHHKKFNNSLVVKTENPSGKKRHRTKFSQEQKEKMYEFSEKLGWIVQKGNDGLVQEFCNDIGVSKGVFKVWMHNNKNNFRKRSEVGNATQTEKLNGDHDGVFDTSDMNNTYNTNGTNNDNHIIIEDSLANVHVSVNDMS